MSEYNPILEPRRRIMLFIKDMERCINDLKDDCPELTKGLEHALLKAQIWFSDEIKAEKEANHV